MQRCTVRFRKTKSHIICDHILSRVDWNSRCRYFRLAESPPRFSCLKAVDKTLQPGSELTHRLFQLATTTSLFPV
jgi:hypothetical protein